MCTSSKRLPNHIERRLPPFAVPGLVYRKGYLRASGPLDASIGVLAGRYLVYVPVFTRVRPCVGKRICYEVISDVC